MEIAMNIDKNVPENLSEKLASLTDKQFQSICEETASLLKKGGTPEGGKAFVDAVIAEQQRRLELLHAESNRLEQECRSLRQEAHDIEKDTERLRQENKYLEQTISTLRYKAGLKVGRNDPCPCGSGKKYKYCCGR